MKISGMKVEAEDCEVLHVSHYSKACPAWPTEEAEGNNLRIEWSERVSPSPFATGWWLYGGDQDVAFPVRFCPFCGVDLEQEMDNLRLIEQGR